MPKTVRLTLPLRCCLPLLLVLSAEGRLSGQSAVDPLLEHARNYEAQQNFAAAEEQYKRALEISPDNPEILKRLGILYQTELKFQGSIELFKEVLMAQPQYPEVNFYLGVSWFGLNVSDAAVASLTQELAMPHPHPKCRYYLALALESQGRADEAIAQFNQQVRQYPKDADALYELARIHKDLSLRAIQMLHDLDPDSFQLHALRGEVYAEDERYPEAIKEYRAALAKRPSANGLHHAIGIAFWAQNQLTDAKNEFLLALKDDPANAMTNLYLGEIALRESNYPDALTYLRSAETGLPRMARVHLLLGKCYRSLKEPRKATDELLKAAEQAPNDPEPHYLLAQLYREANDAESSARELELFQNLSNSETSKRDQDARKAFQDPQGEAR